MLALWIGGCCPAPAPATCPPPAFAPPLKGSPGRCASGRLPPGGCPGPPRQLLLPGRSLLAQPPPPSQPSAAPGMRPGPSGSTGWASGWRGASRRHALAARPVLRVRRSCRTPEPQRCPGYPRAACEPPSGTPGCIIEPGFVCLSSGQAARSSRHSCPALRSLGPCQFLFPLPVLSVLALIPPDAQQYAGGAQGPPVAHSSRCHLNTLGCLDATAMQVPLRGAGAAWAGGTGWTPLLGVNPRASRLPGPHPGHGHRLSLHRAEGETCPISSDVPLSLAEALGQTQLQVGASRRPVWPVACGART